MRQQPGREHPHCSCHTDSALYSIYSTIIISVWHQGYYLQGHHEQNCKRCSCRMDDIWSSEEVVWNATAVREVRCWRSYEGWRVGAVTHLQLQVWCDAGEAFLQRQQVTQSFPLSHRPRVPVRTDVEDLYTVRWKTTTYRFTLLISCLDMLKVFMCNPFFCNNLRMWVICL